MYSFQRIVSETSNIDTYANCNKSQIDRDGCVVLKKGVRKKVPDTFYSPFTLAPFTGKICVGDILCRVYEKDCFFWRGNMVNILGLENINNCAIMVTSYRKAIN